MTSENLSEPADSHAGAADGDIVSLERTNLAPAQIFHRLISPAQQRPRPDIRFGELITSMAMNELCSVWDRALGETPIFCYRLKDVYVSGEGLVFDNDLRLIVETIQQNDDQLIREAYVSLKKSLEEETCKRHYGLILLGGKIGMSNYGHWMIEMLPRVFIAREWILSRSCKVFLPRIYPWMASVIRESLALLGVGRSSCIENDGGAAWFEELIVIQGMTNHGKYYLPVTTECMDEIARTIPPGPAERVWVSRTGERRSIKSEEDVCASLALRGWQIMAPGGLDLRTQISIAKGARHMAGVDGAGLSNIGFMRKCRRVTSFVPAPMPDLFYWSIAINKSLDFREVRSLIEADPTWRVHWDGPLLLPHKEIMRQLLC